MANREDQLGSSGLHFFETLHRYPYNQGLELCTIFKQRSYQLPVQGKPPLLIPVAKHPPYIAQDLLCLLFRSNTLQRAGYLRTKQRIVLLLVGGGHVQDISLIQVKEHLPNCGPFSNGCKVLLQGPHRLQKSGIKPQFGIVSELRYLAGEAEVQVIDVDHKKEGPHNWPLENTTANSGPVRRHTMQWRLPSASFLPTSFQSRQQHCLGCPGEIKEMWGQKRYLEWIWRKWEAEMREYEKRRVTF